MSRGVGTTDIKIRMEKYIRRTKSCWKWTGALDTNGYGQFFNNDVPKGTPAHRTMYQLLVGKIPEGLEIDHLCKNKACVNPAHLEPVTRAENNKRSNSASAINMRKTHCIHGHEYTEENTYRSGRRKCCRTCKLIKYNKTQNV